MTESPRSDMPSLSIGFRGSIIRDKAYYKHFFAIALPIGLQNLLTVSVSLADNIMVGQLGDIAVSSVFMANQVTNILQMFLTGMSAALLIMGSHFLGRDDRAGVRQVTGLTLRLGITAAFLITALTLLFPDRTLRLFTSEMAVIEGGRNYLRIVSLSFPVFIIQGLLIAALRSVEAVKIGTTVTLVALFTNVGLNALLIFGLLGFPALGVEGAAIATLLARMISCAVIIHYAFIKDERLGFRLKDVFVRNPDLTRRFLRTGAPVIIGDLTWGINIAVQGAIIGRLGTVAMTSIAIANTVFNLIAVFIYAFRDAGSMQIGQAVTRDSLTKIKQLTRTLQLLFLGIGIVTGLLMFISRPLFLSFYPAISEAVRSETMRYLTVLSITVIGSAYQVGCLTGIVRGGGSTSFVLWNDLAFVWLLVIPSAALAAFVLNAPPLIVFICLKSDQILKCLVAVIKVNRYTWIKDLTGQRDRSAYVDA